MSKGLRFGFIFIPTDPKKELGLLFLGLQYKNVYISASLPISLQGGENEGAEWVHDFGSINEGVEASLAN